MRLTVRCQGLCRAGVLVVSALVTLAVPAGAQSVVAGPTATQFLASVGQRVTVPVAVDMTGSGGATLGAYRMRVTWNPALLTYISSQGGAFGSGVANIDSVAQGVFKVAGVNASGVGGVTVLGSATWQVASLAAADTLRVSFQELTAAHTFQDLLPILSTTTAQFCGGGSFGDLNNDGAIQALDAQIVATHAVGLAVADTSRGDVDGDQKVISRDALIILSQVVGLNVSAFRVGKLVIGTCVTGAPSAVIVLPGTLALAAGDHFHASANVQAAGGALVSATSLVWTSSQPGIATVDSTGTIHAVASGSTTLTATVAPGVSGTATLTVGPRHRWVVNPALATDESKEVGSDLFPFSTIGAALSRAVDGDTVAVGIATYAEPLTTTKHLVFLGDSTAAGMPTIATPGRTAASLAVTGTQVIRRFRLMNSDGGLLVRADTVDASSLTIEAATNAGLVVTRADHASIRGVTVAGAVGVGLLFDTVRTVQVAQAHVGGITQRDSTFGGFGIFASADTALVDSSSVAGVADIGVEFGLASFARIRATVVTDFSGIAIVTSQVHNLVVDSLAVARGAEGVVTFSTDTLSVGRAHFSDVGEAILTDDLLARLAVSDMTGDRLDVGINVFPTIDVAHRSASIRRVALTRLSEAGIAVGMDTVVVDTVSVDDVDGPALYVDQPALFSVHGARLTRSHDAAVGAERRLGFLSISGSFVGAVGGTDADALRLDADSVLLVADTIHGVAGGRGITVREPTHWLRVRDSRFSNIDLEAIAADSVPLVEIVRSEVDSARRFTDDVSEFQHAVFVRGADSVRMDSTRLHDNPGGALGLDSVRVFTQDSGAVERSGLLTHILCDCSDNTFIVPAMLVTQTHLATLRQVSIRDNPGAGVLYETRASDDTIVVDGSTFHGLSYLLAQQSKGGRLGRIEVRNSAFTGGSPTAVLIASVGSAVLENSTWDSAHVAVDVADADSARIQSNTLVHVFQGLSSESPSSVQVLNNAVSCIDVAGSTLGISLAGPAIATGNGIHGCASGAFVQGFGASDTLIVRDNVVDRAGATNAPQGGLDVINESAARVTVAHNTVSTGDGITVTGSFTSGIVTAHVDTNVITGGQIAFDRTDSVYAHGNTVTGALSTGLFGEAGIAVQGALDTASLVANTVTGGVVPGIRISSSVNHAVLDTNLVTDNGAAGIVLVSSSPTTGRFNAVRRNTTYGIVDSGSTGGSSFTSNDIEGNNIGVGNVGGGATFTATGNWWADTAGPRCTGGATGCSVNSVAGDFVTAGVDFSSYAAASIIGAPAGAPRFPVVAAALRRAPMTSRRSAQSSVSGPSPITRHLTSFGARRPGTSPAPRVFRRPVWPATPRALKAPKRVAPPVRRTP